MGENSADETDEVGDSLTKFEAGDSVLIGEVKGPVDEVDGLAVDLKKAEIVDCFIFLRFASYNSLHIFIHCSN